MMNAVKPYKKRLQYQTYDVTDILESENTIDIFLGKGWYRGRISASDKEINEAHIALRIYVDF